MLKILCPTDFSEHAKIALDYAVHLSNLLDAELHIMTAYQVPSGAAGMIKMNDTIKHNRLLDLQALVAVVKPLLINNTPPVVAASKGMAPAVIANYAKHQDIALVVMGTQGNGSLTNLLFGSVTRKVAKKLHIPLIAIPNDAVFENLKNKNLLLALDSDQVDETKVLDMAGLLANKLNTKIDILHIGKGEKDALVDPFVLKHIENYLGNMIIKESYFPLVEINSYLIENEVGILIMIRRDRSFIEHMFLKGFTDEELGLTSTPLLILPES